MRNTRVVMTACVLGLPGCQTGTATTAVEALAKAFGPVDQKIEVGQGFVVLAQEADTAKLEQDGSLVVVETTKGDSNPTLQVIHQ